MGLTDWIKERVQNLFEPDDTQLYSLSKQAEELLKEGDYEGVADLLKMNRNSEKTVERIGSQMVRWHPI